MYSEVSGRLWSRYEFCLDQLWMLELGDKEYIVYFDKVYSLYHKTHKFHLNTLKLRNPEE